MHTRIYLLIIITFFLRNKKVLRDVLKMEKYREGEKTKTNSGGLIDQRPGYVMTGQQI